MTNEMDYIESRLSRLEKGDDWHYINVTADITIGPEHGFATYNKLFFNCNVTSPTTRTLTLPAVPDAPASEGIEILVRNHNTPGQVVIDASPNFIDGVSSITLVAAGEKAILVPQVGVGNWTNLLPTLSSITGGGGGAYNPSSPTTVTLDETHYVVLINATSNNVTVNLPAASGSTDKIYFIKKIDASANTVTIDGSGAETIDGATTNVLSSQYDVVQIYCDGTEWWVL